MKVYIFTYCLSVQSCFPYETANLTLINKSETVNTQKLSLYDKQGVHSLINDVSCISQSAVKVGVSVAPSRPRSAPGHTHHQQCRNPGQRRPPEANRTVQQVRTHLSNVETWQMACGTPCFDICAWKCKLTQVLSLGLILAAECSSPRGFLSTRV